jgi:flagellar biosynthesis protein FlhB
VKIVLLSWLAGLLFTLPVQTGCLTFELMCLQERPAFMLPYLILGMIALVVIAVIVIVFGIYFLVSSVIVGLIILAGGGLFVGKNFKYNFTSLSRASSTVRCKGLNTK